MVPIDLVATMGSISLTSSFVSVTPAVRRPLAQTVTLKTHSNYSRTSYSTQQYAV
jgi:hypothetical protein